jgi:hypothetical protein
MQTMLQYYAVIIIAVSATIVIAISAIIVTIIILTIRLFAAIKNCAPL